MFFDARAFNQDLSTWVVGQVTDRASMFENSAMQSLFDKWPSFPG
jgi:hypothetical protein